MAPFVDHEIRSPIKNDSAYQRIGKLCIFGPLVPTGTEAGERERERERKREIEREREKER